MIGTRRMLLTYREIQDCYCEHWWGGIKDNEG